MELVTSIDNLPDWMALVAYDKTGKEIAWEKVITDAGVQGLLDELSQWEETYLDSHKKSQHLIHKAAFLVDIGITVEEPRMRDFISSVLQHVSDDGILQTRISVSANYGGTGKPDWTWMLCDAPLLTYTAIKSAGLSKDLARPALESMIILKGEEGWPCKVDHRLGKFRGPGGARQICPYATLLVLKLMSLYPEYHDSEAAHHGVDALLALWDDQKKRKPFLFAMGTDFKKPKAPLIWYDVLHVLMVLTEFEWTRGTRQVHEMTDILRQKTDEQGQIIPESIYMPWKGWEFGQKKAPSVWISHLANQVLKRVG